MRKNKETENQQDTPINENENTAQTTANNPEEVLETTAETDKMAESSEQCVKEWQDKYMRLSAEFDNYRKRTLKEKAELIETGGSDVLRQILSTADDFDRALQHIADEDVKAGVELIYSKFLSSLASKGVKAMELIGEEFNVDYAEAIAKMPAPSPEESGKIMDVAEKGYMIGEKVLRFAKVVVYQ